LGLLELLFVKFWRFKHAKQAFQKKCSWYRWGHDFVILEGWWGHFWLSWGSFGVIFGCLGVRFGGLGASWVGLG